MNDLLHLIRSEVIVYGNTKTLPLSFLGCLFVTSFHVNEQTFTCFKTYEKDDVFGPMLCRNLCLVYLQNINQGVPFCWRK